MGVFIVVGGRLVIYWVRVRICGTRKSDEQAYGVSEDANWCLSMPRWLFSQWVNVGAERNMCDCCAPKRLLHVIEWMSSGVWNGGVPRRGNRIDVEVGVMKWAEKITNRREFVEKVVGRLAKIRGAYSGTSFWSENGIFSALGCARWDLKQKQVEKFPVINAIIAGWPVG